MLPEIPIRLEEGRDFVTEAVWATLTFIFQHLKAHRVYLHCSDVDVNERSWQVAERCGFVREGHLRETHRHLPVL